MTPPIVVAKGKAGLGNRMLSACTAALYARLSGRRLYVDWRDFAYSNDGTNSYPKLFAPRTHDDAAESEIDSSDSVNPPIWLGRMSRSANDLLDELDADKHSDPRIWRKYSFDLTRADHPERVLVMWAFNQQIASVVRGFPRDRVQAIAATAADLLPKLLREEFQLAPTIRQRVDEFAARHFDRPVIGVHVRFMDRRSRVQDFITHVDRIRGRSPGARVFLATDNRDVEAAFHSRYGDVVSTPKWFPEAGVSMHQNPECPDRFRNAVEALADMYLLSRCNWLIYPGSSTFSMLSSLVGEFAPGHVIDIERLNIRVRAKRVLRTLFS